MASRRSVPLGAITRGTTNPDRLRRFDQWIVHRLGARLAVDPDPLVVDLGFGASAVTTLELAARLARRVRPGIRVVGVEIDAARVEAATALADGLPAGVTFAHGGFEIPVAGRPVLVRACNVLRQYAEDEVPPAWATMAARLAPGGLLVEGTCDERGRLASWVAIGPPDPIGGVVPESLTLSVDLGRLERPSRVAERLPKALIHRNVAGEPVHDLLTALDSAWERAAPVGVFGPRQRWVATVRGLIEAGWRPLDGPARWRRGELTLAWAAVAPAAAPGPDAKTRGPVG